MPETSADLRVLFISAEAEPFVRVGGLGDVAGALPQALRRIKQANGHDARIDIRLAIPYYSCISTTGYTVEKIADFAVPSASGPVSVSAYLTHIQSLPVYLISGDPILPGAPVYGKDVKADAEKFMFFSMACLQLPEEIGWKIDILHANDWHTAAALHQLKNLQKNGKADPGIHRILSIHNLPFMGAGAEKALKHYNIPAAVNLHLPEWAKTLPLPMGMDAAEKILTVSPRYAEEIQTAEFGCDLQSFIHTRKNDVLGILNGLDTSVWNPQTDPFIKQTFNSTSLSLRSINKQSLQQELNLPCAADIPLLAYVGRMDRQKGVDLLLDALPEIATENWQVVILGTGNQNLEEAASTLEKNFPQRIRVIRRFDSALSHRIYAGADMLLMPSRYEPCGLAQMIAMVNGCLPIASATGGLVNSIEPPSPEKPGTGFLFNFHQPNALIKTLSGALGLYQQQETWSKMQVSAMDMDFSWTLSAQKYADLYYSLIDD